MEVNKSLNTDTNLWGKDNKQTTEKDIINNLNDDLQNMKELPVIFTHKEETITGLFKDYYKNTVILNIGFGAYNALENWNKDKAILYIKEWLENKPYSPWELFIICKRDHILSKEKINIFGAHIKELDKLYDEFMIFKKNKIEEILNTIRTNKIIEELLSDIDNLSVDLSKEYHKIILYFEKDLKSTSIL